MEQRQGAKRCSAVRTRYRAWTPRPRGRVTTRASRGKRIANGLTSCGHASRTPRCDLCSKYRLGADDGPSSSGIRRRATSALTSTHQRSRAFGRQATRHTSQTSHAMCLRLAEGDTGELNETLCNTSQEHTKRGGGDCLMWYRGQRPGGLEADFDRHSATHYSRRFQIARGARILRGHNILLFVRSAYHDVLYPLTIFADTRKNHGKNYCHTTHARAYTIHSFRLTQRVFNFSYQEDPQPRPGW